MNELFDQEKDANHT